MEKGESARFTENDKMGIVLRVAIQTAFRWAWQAAGFLKPTPMMWEE